MAPNREGRVLRRVPSSITCRTVSSAQMVTCRPASAGPSQICWPPIHKFPDGGTSLSVSTATRGRATASATSVAAAAGAGTEPGGAVSPWRAGMRSSSSDSADPNREAGNAIPRDWCGRSVLYSSRHASSAACNASMLSNGPWSFSSSFCRDWCSRSIFPVVVGEAGRVRRWVMPFSRQIRSNSTSAGRGLMNRPVKTVPLSDKTSSGTP